MASGPHEPNDAVSAAAERFKERQRQQRAEAEAATKARQEEKGDQSLESTHTRNVLMSAAIIALLVGAGWLMLNLMRCDDRYSAISGFLFHECR